MKTPKKTDNVPPVPTDAQKPPAKYLDKHPYTGATMDLDAPQIKSKERIHDHGEVFTAPREVNAMLDLVADSCQSLTARFLEPSCGTGNFLVEILRRKLTHASTLPQAHLHINALIAISSLYGIELLADNATECRARLLQTFKAHIKAPDAIYQAAGHYIDTNIIQGDALTHKRADGAPIVFSEWRLLDKAPDGADMPCLGAYVQRVEYDYLTLTAQREDDLFAMQPLAAICTHAPTHITRPKDTPCKTPPAIS